MDRLQGDRPALLFNLVVGHRWSELEAVCAAVRVEGRTHELGRALITAVMMGSVTGVRLLLAGGADPNAGAADGVPALTMAALTRADPSEEDESGLPVAERSAAIVRLLLAAGARVSFVGPTGTALHAAVYGGDSAKLRLLLEAGVDPNAVDKEGRTALDLAADVPGAERCLATWLSRASGSQAPPQAEYTVLHRAAMLGDALAVARLLAEGADPNARSLRNNLTPLHLAAGVPHGRSWPPSDEAQCEAERHRDQPDGGLSFVIGYVDETIRLLLAAGAEVAPVSPYGTPLHVAASVDNESGARLLLAAGVDVEALDGEGRTALAVAQANRARRVARLLSRTNPGT